MIKRCMQKRERNAKIDCIQDVLSNPLDTRIEPSDAIIICKSRTLEQLLCSEVLLTLLLFLLRLSSRASLIVLIQKLWNKKVLPSSAFICPSE